MVIQSVIEVSRVQTMVGLPWVKLVKKMNYSFSYYKNEKMEKIS